MFFFCFSVGLLVLFLPIAESVHGVLFWHALVYDCFFLITSLEMFLSPEYNIIGFEFKFLRRSMVYNGVCSMQ